MKKISKIITLLMFSAFIFGCSGSNGKTPVTPSQKDEFTVRFLDNLESSLITPSNMEATSFNNVVYSVNVKAGTKVTPPIVSLRPTPGYKFDDWYLEKECKNVYDFDTLIYSNLTLFAGYVRDSEAVIIDDYTEPELHFVEKINEGLGLPLVVQGVLNAPLEDTFGYDANYQHTNSVKLPASGIKKLRDNAQDCLRYLNYERKSNLSELKASFNSSIIHLEFKFDSHDYDVNIRVIQVYYPLSSNSTFESKASRYEEKDYADFGIIMGGSSSMENWTTSVEDMHPITSYNIGIGGSKVEDWKDYMNYRVVYPNNPRGVGYYLGINNIINGSDSGTEVGYALVDMFDDIHAYLPDTTIYFILINHVPGYLQYVDQIDIANRIVEEYSQNKAYMVLIDAGSLLLKANGNPSWAYFRTDGLHMSEYGYVVWGQEVKRVIIDHEEEIYG